MRNHYRNIKGRIHARWNDSESSLRKVTGVAKFVKPWTQRRTLLCGPYSLDMVRAEMSNATPAWWNESCIMFCEEIANSIYSKGHWRCGDCENTKPMMDLPMWIIRFGIEKKKWSTQQKLRLMHGEQKNKSEFLDLGAWWQFCLFCIRMLLIFSVSFYTLWMLSIPVCIFIVELYIFLCSSSSSFSSNCCSPIAFLLWNDILMDSVVSSASGGDRSRD